MRDYALGTTFDLKFTTRSFTTGVPTTLAGTPVISAYPDNNTTELTAGITLTADFDSRTGMNNVRVVATGGNGYASGSNYSLVITTGTVGGVSVVGEVIGEFSLEAQSPLRPTTAGRTLAVDASGRALGDVDTIKTQTVTCAAGVTVLASVGTAATSTAQTGDNFARLGAPAGASLSADVAAINSKTTNLPATPASTTNITTAALGATERSAIADAILDRDMSIGTDSGSTTVRTTRQALRALRNKVSVAAGTITITKEDDTTASWTAVVTTDASASPIVAIDPAGP